MAREQELERAVRNLLAIIDSRELQTVVGIAAIHGFGLDPEVGKRNGRWVDEARLLVQTRSESEPDDREEDGDPEQPSDDPIP